MVERGKYFRFGNPPIAVDILPEIDGIDFDEAWKRRVTMSVDPAIGLVANVISAEDLITAKIAAGRPQDLADVDAVKKSRLAAAKKSHISLSGALKL